MILSIRPFALLTICAFLAACSGSSIYKKALPKGDTAHINNKTKFAVNSYGVAASPRVTTARKVRKGGGRRQLGRPYKIRGKWYTPKEDFSYDKVGKASWYGPNFHGRLTANGEVYDQYGISAAHPTFPLPSYARVTNKTNGRSVIVRVNDRGPYHSGRIIDLSAKAASLLDYKKVGVARVQVEYLKQAPLHGRDQKMLAASFRTRPGPPKAQIQLAGLGKVGTGQPDSQQIAKLSTGSVPVAEKENDPFLVELQAIRAEQDTGTTLSLRLQDAPTPTWRKASSN